MRSTDRVALAPAFLLHARPHGDASQVLDCFSRDHGRLGLVARGARRAGAALRGTLRQFQALQVSWVMRGELGTLTGAEPAGQPLHLTGDALFAGFYANELLLRGLAPHDPHPPLFDAYARLLGALAGGGPPGPLLRRFELALLGELGYGLVIDRCADDDAPVQAGRAYAFDPLQGVRACGVADTEHAVFDGAVLLALSGDALHDAVHASEARRLTRLALDHALGQRPLRTRAVLRQMRRVRRGAGA